MNILILIIMTTLFMSTSVLLGRYISQKNELFMNNYFAEWTIGFITYLLMSFFVWLPLMILKTKPTIMWFIVFNMIKDGIVSIFLFKTKFLNITHIAFKDLFWILIGGTILFLAYHFGLEKISEGKHSLYYHEVELIKTNGQKNSFNVWSNLITIFSNFSASKTEWAHPIESHLYLLENTKSFEHIFFEWITSTLIYAIFASFLINSLYGHGKLERILSLGLAITTIFLVQTGMKWNYKDVKGKYKNSSINLASQMPYYLSLFTILIGARLIEYSRRRYGLLFGFASLVIWSSNHLLIIVLIVVASIIIIIYTYRKQPKPSLFFVQLIVPIMMFFMLDLYTFLIEKEGLFIVPLAGLAFLIFLYSWFTLSKTNKYMELFNSLLLKYRILVPTLFIGGVIIAMIVLSTHNDIPWTELTTLSHPIFTFDHDSSISEVISFYALIALAFSFILYKMYKRKSLNHNLLIFTFIVISFIIVYNPLIEKGIMSIEYYRAGFQYLKIMIIPIILVTFTSKSISLIKQ